MLKLLAFGLALALAAGLAVSAGLAAGVLVRLAADALHVVATTPAGPLLVLLATLGSQRPAPVRSPAGLLTLSDRAFLAYLLTREVRYGA